jgi:putative ABC transport system ATP-binding protein
VSAGTGQPLLAGHDLAKSYGPTPALAGADLEIAAGELVAIMGPSGLREVHVTTLPGRHRAAG